MLRIEVIQAGLAGQPVKSSVQIRKADAQPRLTNVLAYWTLFPTFWIRLGRLLTKHVDTVPIKAFGR